MQCLARYFSPVAVLCFFLFALTATAAPVPVPGTKVRLEPPPGFSPSSRFPGFQQEEIQASIMVTELPVAAGVMKKGMTKEGLASKGVSLLTSETLQVDGGEVLLLHGAQTAVGIDYLKWMLVTGDETTTVLVLATFPKSEEARVGEALRRAVLTTSFTAGNGDPWAGLSFRVTPTARLEILHRVSNMLMLAEPGKKIPLAAADPILLVSASISAAAVEDLAAFSRTRARQTERVHDLENEEGRAIKVGGRDAYELLADATDTDEGIALRLYQVIVPDETGYHLVQGLVGANRAAEMIPEFRRLTESFVLVEEGE